MYALIEKKQGPVASFFSRINPFSSKKYQAVAYHGGGHGAMSSGGKWAHGLSAAGASLFLDHRSLRQNARVALQDSSQGRAIVERKVDAIAHTGLRLEATPDSIVLGISQEQATEWARNVSSRFNLWAKDKKQHRSETMNFYQAQWFYTFFKERDNDIFVRLHYSPDRLLQNPLQFSFLDPDQIRGFGFTTSYGFQHNRDGIIRDDRGRETGYEIWIRKKGGTFETVTIQARGPKSGRRFMLHGWRPEYAGQGRGFSKLAPIIQDLENLTDFSSAHIKQAINQATFVAWIKPSTTEDAQPLFDNIATAYGAGPAAANFSNETTAEETGLGDFECYDLPEATVGQPGSMMIQNLTKGADITLANPNSPSTTYDRFIDAFMTSIAASMGVPLEVVHMKFASNFSASRAALLLFQRVLEIERDDMAADFLDPTYEMWMTGEISAGRISAPGWTDPRLRKAWLKATWR
ncbi:MAG: phage portal protein, partial [Nitrospinaceae bacterium]